MNKGIKSKTAVRDIKVLDKSIYASQKIKKAYIHTKNQIESGNDREYNSPDTYAADRFSSDIDNGVHKTIYEFNKQGLRGIKKSKENLSAIKEKFNILSSDRQSRKQILNDIVSEPSTDIRQELIFNGNENRQAGINAINRNKRKVKYLDHSIKSKINHISKSVKPPEYTAKSSIKANQRINNILASSKSKSVKSSIQSVRNISITTSRKIKSVTKSTISTIKSMIATSKATLAAIMAGGWIAVTIVIIICLISMIIGSGFGIFFSGEESISGQTMKGAVQEINADYLNQLAEIKQAYSYDVLEMSGSQAVWKEVLAVYAIKTTTDSENAQEVATINDAKKQILKDIFWQMNEISSHTESKTETIVITSEYGNGNII